MVDKDKCPISRETGLGVGFMCICVCINVCFINVLKMQGGVDDMMFSVVSVTDHTWEVLPKKFAKTR